MHDIYRTLANDIATDRLREAAYNRLARDARAAAAPRDRSAGIVALLIAFVRQAVSRPSMAADLGDCR
jgi:hypothetical protein